MLRFNIFLNVGKYIEESQATLGHAINIDNLHTIVIETFQIPSTTAIESDPTSKIDFSFSFAVVSVTHTKSAAMFDGILWCECEQAGRQASRQASAHVKWLILLFDAYESNGNRTKRNEKIKKKIVYKHKFMFIGV